jgi:beta-hydroxylase
MFVTISLFLVVIFIMSSMAYVYKYRGAARYEGMTEYLRKGWPIFTPLNCLLYLFSQSRARAPIMNLKDFSELDEIKKNWQVIQREALNLKADKYFEYTNKPGSPAYYDIGFRTFFKYGWSKFYLTWYGYTHKSAKELCPETVKILEKIPSVNGAMFSYLPAGSQLTRHLDPIACSLRYHLGLVTPNSDNCFINIDNVSYSWRDGEALLFDETFIHYAKNDTVQDRLILMCDIDRPMNFFGRFINFIYKGLARLTVVPNLEGDKRGFANLLFSGLSPLIKKSKDLKATNRPLYLLLKYAVSTTLILIVFALFAGALKLISSLIQ